jgi:hypothetical protein
MTPEEQLSANLAAQRSVSDLEEQPRSLLSPLPYLTSILFSPTAASPDAVFPEPLLPMTPPMALITDLAKLTEMRGGQAAGLASVSWSATSKTVPCVRARAVVAKRATGASTMTSAWQSAARKATVNPSNLVSPDHTSSALFMGHLRFATSSRNKENESHPHIWLPWRKESAWFSELNPTTGRLELVNNPSATCGHMLTHNGDFDAVSIYNSPMPQADVGRWLGIMLSSPCKVDSDSAKVAGYFDVFSTRGRWMPSARRAWVLAVSKSERDVLEPDAPGSVPFPGATLFQTWGALFERGLVASRVPGLCPVAETRDFKTAVSHLESSLIETFSQNPHTYGMNTWRKDTITEFVVQTISSFFTADIFACMSSFLRSASGSFGLAVSCATEDGAVVLSAMGQPMAFSLDPMLGLVLYGSEVSAVRIPVQENFAPLRYRYNIDDADGEVVRIGKRNHNRVYLEVLFSDSSSNNDTAEGLSQPIHTRLSSQFSSDMELSFDKLSPDFLSSPGELLNSFVLQQRCSAVPPAGDIVLDDIRDIPQTLREITIDWGETTSTNRQTANDFVHLFADARYRHRSGGIDLLITGIESSLWLGEQLAADFKIVFPTVNVVCVSANKLLGALEAVPRMVHFCGYNRISSEQLQRDRPVVLCISQSGQTFATLHATRQLLSILHGNVFLVTGQADTKMREAVIDSLGDEAGNRRVIYNHSNLRVAEPSTVATCAMHHTLTEFLLYVSQCCCVIQSQAANNSSGSAVKKKRSNSFSPLGKTNEDAPEITANSEADNNLEMAVIRDDLVDFRDLVDSLHDDLPELCHESSRTNGKLRDAGTKWAQHITESWRVMVLSGVYILVTVISGHPLFSLITLAAGSEHPALVYSMRTLDAILFIMLPKLLSYLLRWIEGRTILARHGKRTLVICDVPWVHQNLENYVTKLFALSYSFLNIECHGTCAHDDMVHNFTHRVARGTLLALGRPDGRVLSLLKTEQTIMLAAKQAAFIENMNVGPEIFTVGHNNVKSSIASGHLCIHSTRRKFLSETLYDFALAAKTSSLEKEDFEKACISIMGNLWTQSVKLGPAYPRRMLTVGVCHAKDDDDGALDGGSNGSGGGIIRVGSDYSLTDSGSGHSVGSGVMRSALRTGKIRSLSTGSDDDHAEEVLAMTAANRSVTISEPEEGPGKSAGPTTPMTKSGRRSFFESKAYQDDVKNHENEETLLAGDPLQGSKHATLNLSLDARYAFASRLPDKVRKMLGRTKGMEHLFESRVASFERYVSMLIMFHAMAEKASRPWLLAPWDISRSQSNLRVATTACPVSVEEDDESDELGMSMAGSSIPGDEFEQSKHVVAESIERVGRLEGSLAGVFPVSAIGGGAVVTEEEEDPAGSGGGGMKKITSIGAGMSEMVWVKKIESVSVDLNLMGGGEEGGGGDDNWL